MPLTYGQCLTLNELRQEGAANITSISDMKSNGVVYITYENEARQRVKVCANVEAFSTIKFYEGPWQHGRPDSDCYTFHARYEPDHCTLTDYEVEIWNQRRAARGQNTA